MPFAAPDGTVLEATLGAGTMFDVALVREGDRTLVCKRLTSRTVREPAGRAAIVREAKLLTLAKHPALPGLVRVGSDAHGPFVLETRASGASVREIVDGWHALGRKMPASLVSHVGASAFAALEEIQRLAGPDGPLELVHGDLGPDHVVLGPIGQIRLVDFGAARWRGMDDSLATRDRGTLPYVAPEIARGEAEPSQAGDVYAMCATIAFLSLGRPPCDARDEAALLVEVGERGLRLDLLEAAAGLSEGQRDALKGGLAFEAPARVTLAEIRARWAR